MTSGELVDGDLSPNKEDLDALPQLPELTEEFWQSEWLRSYLQHRE